MKYDINKIKELYSKGMIFKDIAKTIGCSIETVKYHLIPNRKINLNKYTIKISKNNPLHLKRKRFITSGEYIPFTLNELILKIGNNPKCYITDEPIDLLNSKTYSLDHIIPISRGGKSSLDNLGLVKADINQAKYNMTPFEFLNLCKRTINGSLARIRTENAL